MTSDLDDFRQFMQQREDMARAYVRGEAEPLAGIVARTSPATFFGPQGGYRQGTDEVAATYARDAASFSTDGDSELEILEMAASDGLAYWTGFQHASARLRGRPVKTTFNLRVTEVFRREGREWKLVHRHADALTSKADPPQ